MKARFLGVVVASVCCSLLCVATLVWPDWIELCVDVDPDHGTGTLEALIVAWTAIAAVATLAFAGAEWRRSHSISAAA